MDLANPINSIISSGHGPVLAVLARTERPMSGRQIAELTRGQVSKTRVNEILRQLTDVGIVNCERHPPAKLYTLNRDHVAAEAVVALASLREKLLARIRDAVSTWAPAPRVAWLFGSFARGGGGVESDIDILVIRADDVDENDPGWAEQIDSLSTAVRVWSGNRCIVMEYSDSEFDKLIDSRERLPREVRRDAIHLGGIEASHRIPLEAS